MLTRRRVLVGAAWLASGAIARAEPPAGPKLVLATKLFPYLDRYLGLPPAERSRFALRYRFLGKDGRPDPGLRLALVDGAVQTPIPLTPEGAAERLPTAAEFGRGVQVRVESPNPGHKIDMEVEARIALAPEIAAAEITASAAQLTAGIRRLAGPIGVFAPKFTRAVFRGAQAGVLVGADGRETPLPAPHRWPVADLEALKGARAVRFARAPAMILLEPPEK